MEHDFRRTYWGHNFGMTLSPDGDYSGWTISTPVVKVGDTLVWETAYGEAVVKVTESYPRRDPMDMSAVRGIVVERRVREEYIQKAKEAGETPPWEYTLLKKTK